ncbi:MAG: cupredoxin domain-containing protein [Gemmatimonadota bacterium]
MSRLAFLLWFPILSVLVGGCGPSPDADDRTRAGGDAGEAPATRSGPGRVVIRMLDDMSFDPPHAVVTAGDTVVWVNAGKLPHTATADPRRARDPTRVVLPDGAEIWDSGTIDEGAEYRRVLPTPGAYAYVCTLHEMAGMTGTLEVRN